jgi:hypothetical protein
MEKGIGNAGLRACVAGGGDDLEVGLGPGFVEVPSVGEGADNIIAPMDNDAGDIPEGVGVFNEPVIGLEKGFVHKIVAFDAGKSVCMMVFGESAEESGVEAELKSAPFPCRPGLGRLLPDLGIRGGKPFVVGLDEVVSFGQRDGSEEFFEEVGKKMVGAILIKPAELFLPREENAAHDERLDSGGMSLGVSESQRTAPRTTEDDPAIDMEVAPKLFNVGDEIPGSILFQASMGGRFAASPLVKEDDPVEVGIEEGAVGGIGAASRAAVKKENRPSLRIARLFPIEVVDRRNLQAAALIRLDRGIALSHLLALYK